MVGCWFEANLDVLELTEFIIIFSFTDYIFIYKTKVNDYSQSGHRPTGEGGGHGTFMCRQFDLLVMVLITDEKITRVIRKVIEFFSIWLSTFFTGTTESHIGKYNISEKKPPIKKITSALKPTNNHQIF